MRMVDQLPLRAGDWCRTERELDSGGLRMSRVLLFSYQRSVVELGYIEKTDGY